jgi:F-type H+-transporting ATPase subunit a
MKIPSFLTVLLLLLVSCAMASETEPAQIAENHTATAEKPFNAGEMIIEHIIDAHEWHIMAIGETHISVPLPVILFSNGGFHVFMSSKFHHGHEAYKGFRLMNEGPQKGKIVHVTTSNGIETVDKELPIDLSITKNVLAIFISVFIISFIFISISKSYKRNAGHAPKGMQSVFEVIILFIRDDIAKSSIGEKKYERFLPFLLTVFFFILINNMMGLIPLFPGGANVTGNIAVTMVLALFTFIITSFNANKGYWKHIINAPGVPWWLKFPVPLMPIVELVGVFTKPFVLMVRLFANITAGHIIILGFMSLIFIFGNMNMALGYSVSPVSLLFAIFMGLLELLVAFLQAYVFTLLSAIYFGLATEEHHETQH